MAAAKLIGWGGRVLYLGPAFGLTPHRNATAVLAVGLDAQLEVADDPADRTTHYRAARSVLILPNSLHHLRIERGRMAFLYVDPLGRDLKALIARMTNTTPRAAFDLQGRVRRDRNPDRPRRKPVSGAGWTRIARRIAGGGDARENQPAHRRSTTAYAG